MVDDKANLTSLKHHKISKVIREHLSNKIDVIHAESFKRIVFNWLRVIDRFLPLGNVSKDNKVQFFFNGDEAFSSMLDAINNAKKKVWLETYILVADKVGKLFIEAIAGAAKRKCDVILLYDHFGSSSLKNSDLAIIQKNGGKALDFNPIWPWRRSGPMLFRDHRKLLIVDDDIAFCGSMNISEEYSHKLFAKGRFRDTHVKIVGSAATDLSRVFAGSLGETTGKVLNISTPQEKKDHQGVVVQVLSSNRRRNARYIQKSLSLALQNSIKYCYFTTPYFVPSFRLHSEIVKAVKRGVDVRIVTAGTQDVALMKKAHQHVYGWFLKDGVRIYEMFGKVLHSKSAVVDGIFSTVGSFNLDQWSDRHNLEVNTAFIDSQSAKKLHDQFILDMKSSKEVLLENWQKRSLLQKIWHWVCYLIARI